MVTTRRRDFCYYAQRQRRYSLGAKAAVPIPSPLHTPQATRSSYQAGYNQGFSEPTSSKCLDGNNFEYSHYAYYRPRAMLY